MGFILLVMDLSMGGIISLIILFDNIEVLDLFSFGIFDMFDLCMF